MSQYVVQNHWPAYKSQVAFETLSGFKLYKDTKPIHRLCARAAIYSVVEMNESDRRQGRPLAARGWEEGGGVGVTADA